MPNYTFECARCGKQRHEVLSLVEHDKASFYHCKKPMFQVIGASQIVKDIEPYKAVAVDVATGKPPVITSRRTHREFLKRNGYVEIGNEPIRQRKPDFADVTPREVK